MDLRAVLVDDEQLARDELGYLLNQVGGVEVIGQAGNGIEALSTIERLHPDVVFLDVQMPGLTGFEVARRLVDNGVGVSAADSDRVKGAGIGLRNVNERLRVIYGANYQLQLDSVPGEGTCARIVIPEMAVASRITA